jgi:hypothetical protein
LHAPVYGYLSNEPSEPDLSDDEDESHREGSKKRCKLDVPAREQVRLKKEKRQTDLRDALTAIEKMISLKRMQYQSPLQAKRVRVIQSTLHLVV